MNINLHTALKGKLARLGGAAWNRLNLMRDAGSVRSYDFGPEDLREVRHLMEQYAANRPQIRTINWLVPNVRHPLFAGIHTVLRFADYFSREKGIKNRIVFYGATKPKELARLKEKIGASFPLLADDACGLTNPDALPVSDIGIATFWTSAYLLLRAKNTVGKFYFVQDFEPSFYPAGTTYGLAEATYRLGFWGIANTRGLGDLLKRSYDMTLTSFQPAIDRSVFFPSPKRESHPIKIFFYGRPTNPRNGFLLGIEALKKVKARFKDRVRIVSAGGKWSPSEFGARGAIENLGLLPTIQEVADLYRSCHIGLFFMFTSHPSYQPLEMMASGTAIVSNNNHAIRSFLRDGSDSLLVEPSIMSVADAVSTLVANAELRTTLAAEGLRAAEKASWQTEIERVYSFITQTRASGYPTDFSEEADLVKVSG